MDCPDYNLELTDTEQRLVAAAACGVSAVIAGEIGSPSSFEWQPIHEIRASVIRLLALGLRDDWSVDPRGIRLLGARVTGVLDLENADVRFALALVGCQFAEKPILSHARTRTLRLSGSWLPGLEAPGASVDGNLELDRGFISLGQINLQGAGVVGDLVANEGALINRGAVALSADRIRVTGGLFLHNARATGEVRLLGANVGGNLQCNGATLENSAGTSLNADDIQVGGGVFLQDGLRSEGEIRLVDAAIGGSLQCDAAFNSPNGDAVVADRVEVVGDIALQAPFKAAGTVRLTGAKIGGRLTCRGATFTKPDGDALIAESIESGGSAFLDCGFSATGTVRLTGATIGGSLSCAGGQFSNPSRKAIYAKSISVAGDVYLGSDFAATGEVNLLGATVGGSLICQDGTFENPGGCALAADGIHVTGAIHMRGGFTAVGATRLPGAQIGGDVDCSHGSFTNGAGSALRLDGTVIGRHLLVENTEARGELTVAASQVKQDLRIAGAVLSNAKVDLDHAVVGGMFTWREIAADGGLTANLAHLRAAYLLDDADSWRQVDTLILSGFRYDRISEHSSLTPEQRVEWVAQPRQFSTQPYEQLARVLRESGRPAQARKVLQAKEDAIRTRGDLKAPMRAWNRFLGFTVGHGYQLWRPLVAIAALLLAATVVLWLGAAQRAIVLEADPTTTADEACPVDHPCFQPFVFALDTLLPIVDLDQDDAWRPKAGAPRWGTILQIGWWVYVLAGWTLTTAVVAGFGALLRRD